ncbi:aldose epimerase family protein [Neobacillus jeddahensis]|uniref:aldose epimerase family protein n=1 Tax=Neobacillus jeddahensis TaxID=1461580 RepID=UPI00058FB264|nr:aldose epimerase family protein [Neobacillus jeddahensis]
MKLVESCFGTFNGKQVTSYSVENANGMSFTCIDYGCIITEINVPDREGAVENVVLGFDTVQEYLDHSPYFGCVIGRTAGRIGQASFEIDGVPYHLAKNDGEHNLHGGPNGFHNVVWESVVENKEHETKIIFSYTSPDREEGFPGKLAVTVTYTFNEENELTVSYQAVSDQKTIVNLTNHSYFNLSGHLKRTILDHELTVNSDGFLELDTTLIPTGKVLSVEGTVFDFREGKKIRLGIESDHPQTQIVGGGFDHPLLFNDSQPKKMMVVEQESGRKLEIDTDQPAVVFYTGNMLGNDFSIRGRQAEKHLGFCLETQQLPNRISELLVEKNEVYKTTTTYRFSLENK